MKVIGILFLFTFLCLSSQAKDLHFLIQEMEELRDSLELDDPARVELTLRLADLYFDVSIKEGGEGNHEELKANREKALVLYRHSLEGTDGVKRAEGLTRLKIQFQMARLLSRLDQYERAEPYYLEVQAHPKVPKKMKEQASLALAEWYEQDAVYPKAKKFYDQAIELCDVKASCNYAHYRKGWLYFKDTKLEDAIAEMKASLWTEGDQVRESSLQDLILFMSNADTDGFKELEYTSALAKKTGRPELVQKLVEAFYVAGNRRAGANLLSEVNEKTPSLYFETRLLEEFYGFRKWEKVDELLLAMEKRSAKDIPAKKDHASEVKKIFRRYLVQVDSEANVAPELNTHLKRSIDIYLTIYPNDDLRKKLQQGWLKAEEDKQNKIIRLGEWIKEDIGFGFKKSEIRKLRQTRLSLAQKLQSEVNSKKVETELKLSPIIIEEALALAEILSPTKEAEEFRYVAAREYYSQKNFEAALPLFKGLVDAALERKAKGEALGKWALLSQNLVLDIFNSKDDYSSIIDQVELWKGATAELSLKDKKLASENQEMSKLKTDARFALAAKMTDSKESLDEFYKFCFEGVYEKKSCSNAKVLAVKFKDQAKLIKLLEKANDEEALMNEYELMGRYSDAARLQEKLNLKKQGLKAPYELYLKIALLYELDKNRGQRDRILSQMMKKMKRSQSLPKEIEGVLFLTLDEAGLIDSKALFLPWSLKRKLSLARRLELEKPSAQNRKLIMAQSESQGPIWSRIVLKKFEKPMKNAMNYKFYGRYSQYRFKKRTKRIENFVTLSKKYLEGADLETRVYILHMVTRVYGKMVEDILATPLPKDLDEATLAQVQIQLQQMAVPFETVRGDYQRLLEEQMKDLKTELKEDELKRISSNLESNPAQYASLIPMEEKTPSRELALEELKGASELKAQLLEEPNNRSALKELKSFYEDQSVARLAAYYKGRLEALGPEPVVVPKGESNE